MPINTVCPECDSRFLLQDNLQGQSMRCPVCKKVFIALDAGELVVPKPVEALPTPQPAAPARPRSDAPASNSRTGNITDFVPLVADAVRAEPKKPTQAEIIPPPVSPRETKWSDDIVSLQPRTGNTIINLEAAGPDDVIPLLPRTGRTVVTLEPVEVAWSPDLEPPSAKKSKVHAEPAYRYEDSYVAPTPPPDDSPVAMKKRRGRWGVIIGSVVLVLLIVGGGVAWKLNADLIPERILKSAKDDYEAQKFDQARKLYEQLATEYPDHPRATEAKFFGELSTLRHIVLAVTTRNEPQAAIAVWKKFLTTIDGDEKLAPFAARDRFGVDIWQAGSKLSEDVAAKANEVFDRDSTNESETLAVDAATIDSSLDRFRPKDIEKSATVVNLLAALRDKIIKAQDRLGSLNEATAPLKEPTVDSIREAEKRARENGIINDQAFQDQIAEAHKKLEVQAVYKKRQPVPPIAYPDDGLTSLLFAPRLDKAERRDLTGPPTVFFALARGVLYALDEVDGHVLWATRTGLDCDIMPVRVPASPLNPEMVLVASNDGSRFGLTGRSARDGRPLWHQPLPSPCVGMPVVVGSNTYVATGDAKGTIVEIAVATGEITGEISTGRPLGPYMANRPGTSLLYAPADAHGVYVWDVDRRGPNGEHLEPQFLGAMNTGHAAGTLQGIPAFSNPEPDSPGPKYLVLGQADSLEQMKLRAFSLPATIDGKPEGSAPATELVLDGWASFAPACDGEKLAIVTDKGEFSLFGLALAGNRDLAIFALPSRPGKVGDRPARGQVVMAEEGAYWIIARGELRKLRFGINGQEGVRLITQGDPIVVGEPLHPSQLNTRGDTFVVVTQEGLTCRATAVDSASGSVRWRRDLGITVKGDPLQVGDALLLADQAGGFYRVETAKLTERENAAWLIDERWMIAQPAVGFSAVTNLIAGPNNSAFMMLLGEGEKSSQFLIRRFDGTAIREQLVPTPSGLAGTPTVSGSMVYLPLSNGTLYRINLADGRSLEEGPSWRAERQSSTATCYLAPLNDNEIFATDGGRSIVRWNWPAGSKLFESKGKLTLSERLAASPVLLTGSPPRLMLGDSKGNIYQIDADKLALPALAIWKTGQKNNIPAGTILDGLRPEKNEAGVLKLVYSVGGVVVALNPDNEAPFWIADTSAKPTEGRIAFRGNRFWQTDRAGTVRVFDAETGKATGEEFRVTGSHAFAAAAIPISNNRLLAPLADGTVLVGQVKGR